MKSVFMMVRFLIFSVFLIFITETSNAQRPIRGTVFYENEKKNTNTEKGSGESSTKLKRFADTVTIAEKGEKTHKTPTRKIEMEVDEAMRLFDNQEYVLAHEKFTQLSGTITTGDPLLMDVLFMAAECDAVLGNYNEAEKQLVKLTTRGDITNIVLEKALVRLGHVFCVQKKTSEAEQAFKRLRTQFPETKYGKLADCSAIK